MWKACILVPAVGKQDHTVHMEAYKPSYNLQTMGRLKKSVLPKMDSSMEASGEGRGWLQLASQPNVKMSNRKLSNYKDNVMGQELETSL